MAKQILSYFLRNPQAIDTLAGISRWRLLEEEIHQSVQMTEQALTSLVKMGFLLREQTRAAGILYRLNEARRGEAEAFAGRPSPSKHQTLQRKDKRSK